MRAGTLRRRGGTICTISDSPREECKTHCRRARLEPHVVARRAFARERTGALVAIPPGGMHARRSSASRSLPTGGGGRSPWSAGAARTCLTPGSPRNSKERRRRGGSVTVTCGATCLQRLSTACRSHGAWFRTAPVRHGPTARPGEHVPLAFDCRQMRASHRVQVGHAPGPAVREPRRHPWVAVRPTAGGSGAALPTAASLREKMRTGGWASVAVRAVWCGWGGVTAKGPITAQAREGAADVQ